MKRLMPEEVPVDFRHLFHFDKQRVCEVYNNRTGLKIQRDCIQCGSTYETNVSQLRADFKRGRKMRGQCMSCRNDGTVITSQGYVWIHMPEYKGRLYQDKYVPQHILVMEESIGRYLDRDTESVHHINGDKADNRIENLQLRKKYHGKGQKWTCNSCGSHDVVAVELD